MLAQRDAQEAIFRMRRIYPHSLYFYLDYLYDEIPKNRACSIPYNVEIELIEADFVASDM